MVDLEKQEGRSLIHENYVEGMCVGIMIIMAEGYFKYTSLHYPLYEN